MKPRMLAAFLDAATDGVFLLDLAGRFTYVNRVAAELFAAAALDPTISPSAIIGRTSRELGLSDEFSLQFDAHLARALQGETVVAEAAFPVPSGLRTHEYVLSPICGQDDAVIAIGGITRDVHERTLAANERDALRDLAEARVIALEELDQLKEDFIATASHDLRGPLTAIRGFAQVLLRRVGRRPPDLGLVEHGLTVIDEQAAALGRLVDDLLDASRIQGRAFDVRVGRCDLVVSLDAVLARLGPEDRARVEVDLVDATLVGEWEARRIEQVLANLVSNALKYSPEGTPVVVRAAECAAGVEVAVIDQGVGIPREELPGLFARFHRTPEARASRVQGTGLGLFICRGIVDAHGGRLWAESAGAGHGATCRFTLPRTFVSPGV